MVFVRRVFRILLLSVWSLMMMAAAFVSMLFVNYWTRCRLGTFWAQVWSRGAAWLAGIRLTVHGRSGAENGCLVVSNHLGYFDVLVHASVFKIRFAPKKEIRNWPVFGWLTSLGSPIWIDRSSPQKAKEYASQFSETMKRGISLLVYPEGTSSDGKHGLLPFKSTPFAAAIESKAVIVPTLMFYREKPESSPPAAWFGDISFGAHVWRSLGIKRIEVDLYILEKQSLFPGEDRKNAALRIHDIMEKEYWKIEN